MSTNKTNERQRKERQKRLRKGLLAFLKRLRQACKSYESLGDWNDLVQPLESMLDEYAQDLPQGKAQRLREAMNLKAATAEGIQAGCQVLQKEIEGVVDLLPAGGILGSAVIGAFIVAAVGVAVAVVVFNSSGHKVMISNQGCGDIPIPSAVRSIPGLGLPAVIQNDQTASATIPSILNVDVEVGGQERTMTIWISGIPLQFGFKNRIQGLTFDRTDLMIQKTRLDFGNPPPHELILTCP